MAEIEIGDIVMADSGSGSFHAVVRSVRLGRLVVDRCDGRSTGPLSVRDVTGVYKPAGAPAPASPTTQRLRPTAQLRLELE
jgi:hypothetical protein